MRAYLLTQDNDTFTGEITEVDPPALGPGQVRVSVEMSSLNYKDGLVVNGLGRLVRTYPHVPGIDLAGEIIDGNGTDWAVGTPIIVTGYHMGERSWGGYGTEAVVNADWLVRRPAALGARQAMIAGTAGFTAMQAILALESMGLQPGSEGEVLVTGGAGGVGSIAINLLSRLGYTVTTSSGRAEQADYLHGLGASTIIPRAELSEGSGKPLEKERFIGCIDTVGGSTLANVLPKMAYGASVAAVGLAGGAKFDGNVTPFLLRGVNILGIDSVLCPADKRLAIWERLSPILQMPEMETVGQEIGLAELPAQAKAILKGQVRGRVVVNPHN